MGEQAILVQMLSDVQARLGRIESTQSEIQQEVASVSTRVAVVEEHCKGTGCTGPKSGGTSGSYLGLSLGTWIRYAAIALVAAYGLGKVQTAEQRTQILVKAITDAKLVPDSCLIQSK